MRSSDIAAPSLEFPSSQLGLGQGFCQGSTCADFFVIWSKLCDRGAVSEKNEGDILVVRTVDTLGKITRRLGYAYCRFLHKLRLSYSAKCNYAAPSRVVAQFEICFL